jgi:DNA repair exonuclease SbcCD nuclease subunit
MIVDKTAYINDPHFMDGTPRSRKDNYRTSLLIKLEEVIDVCNRIGVKVLVITGDMFNFKEGNKTSHGLVIKVNKLLHKFNGEVYLVLGNHDMKNHSIKSIEDHPVGALLEMGKLKLLESPIELDNCVITGSHYEYNQEETKKVYYPEVISNGKPIIHVVHASLYAKDEEAWPPCTFFHEILDTPAKVIISGHIHDDLGINCMETEDGDKYFINLGSLSRGSSKEINLNRILKFLVVEAYPPNSDSEDSLIFKEVHLENYKPVDEIFKTEEIMQVKRRKQELDSFVESLRNSVEVVETVNIYTVAEDLAKFNGVRPEVLQMTIDYIRQVEFGGK